MDKTEENIPAHPDFRYLEEMSTKLDGLLDYKPVPKKKTKKVKKPAQFRNSLCENEFLNASRSEPLDPSLEPRQLALGKDKPELSSPAPRLIQHDEVPKNVEKVLFQYPWYAGAMSRAEAEDTLQYYTIGTFLVRKSPSRDVFVFSVKQPIPSEPCNNLLIQYDHDSKSYSVADEEAFTSIPELVDFYSLNWKDFGERMWGEDNVVQLEPYSSLENC